jgi:hypothetical protein
MEREVEDEGRGLMLLRFILFSVIAYFLIRFFRGLMSGMTGTNSPADAGRGKAPRQTPRAASSALMIRCAACGTFITESSAVLAGSRVYCSNSCAKVGTQSI